MNEDHVLELPKPGPADREKVLRLVREHFGCNVEHAAKRPGEEFVNAVSSQCNESKY
jgi:hypothetical protein